MRVVVIENAVFCRLAPNTLTLGDTGRWRVCSSFRYFIDAIKIISAVLIAVPWEVSSLFRYFIDDITIISAVFMRRLQLFHALFMLAAIAS
jgi:hypothetical protein